MRFRFLIILILTNSLIAPNFAFAYGGNGGPGDSTVSSETTTETTAVVFIVEGKPEPGSNSNGTQNKPSRPLSTRNLSSDAKIALLKAGLWTVETIDSVSMIGFYIGGKKVGIAFPVTFVIGGVYHTTKNLVRILVYGWERNIELNERSIGGRYVNVYILNRGDTRKRTGLKLELEKNQVIHYDYKSYTPPKKASP